MRRWIVRDSKIRFEPPECVIAVGCGSKRGNGKEKIVENGRGRSVGVDFFGGVLERVLGRMVFLLRVLDESVATLSLPYFLRIG